MQSNKGSHVIIHESVGILPFLTTKTRFDVDLTGKMTEFDQTKYRFGILSENAVEQGVTCHESLILGDFTIFDHEKPVWRRFDR